MLSDNFIAYMLNGQFVSKDVVKIEILLFTSNDFSNKLLINGNIAIDL